MKTNIYHLDLDEMVLVVYFFMECFQEKVFDLCSLGGLNPAEGTLNVSYLAIFMFNDFWVLVRKPK